jgi:cation diffusion facilitator CzcD-associated flavoprotein CzcO
MIMADKLSSHEDIALDVLVVGAGFGGIYALHKMRLMGFTAKAFEKGSGVGGTWFWNRYPGARCDVPSLEYSYSFSDELQQEWEWSERHATQPEIERYANHVVDRFDLRKDIQFNTTVVSAQYDADANLWHVETSEGQKVRATYLIMTTGGYHIPAKPNFKGLENFKGEVYFSNYMPTTPVSYDGKRIGLIGTGSSGIQATVELGKRPIEHLYLFQRSPGYMVPSHDKPLEAEEIAEFKRTYAERRERARHSGYGVDVASFPVGSGRTMDLSDEEFEERAWKMFNVGGGSAQTLFPDFASDAAANKRISNWLNDRVRERVKDPELAEALTSQDYYMGAKRIIIIDGFIEAVQQDNVTVVNIRKSPIVEVTPTGVRTTAGEYPVDLLLLATGFDSGTGSLLQIDIRGRDGLQLREKWANGPEAYLGLGVQGFPNMFVVAQVASPGIRSHVMVSIEQHVDWIADLIDYATRQGVNVIEASRSAEQAWTKHVADVADMTLFTKDDTQHLGSNIPGKPRVVSSYLGGVGNYRRICDAVKERVYEGWELHTKTGKIANSPDWTEGKAIRWEDRDNEVAAQSVQFL